MYQPVLQKMFGKFPFASHAFSEQSKYNTIRRRAWSLVCWPYALSLLSFALFCFSFFGNYGDLTLAILYAGMMACLISLSAHVLTYGWLHPKDAAFDDMCREMNSTLVLSHEQYRCIQQAAARDPQIAKYLAQLQEKGLAWDNALADRCRYATISHTS
jgi:hypothetical protein